MTEMCKIFTVAAATSQVASCFSHSSGLVSQDVNRFALHFGYGLGRMVFLKTKDAYKIL